MRRRVAVVVLSVLAVACGGSAAPESASQTTLPSSTDVTPTPTPESPPSSSLVPSVPTAPESLPPPDPPSTPTTVGPAAPADAVMLGPPDPSLVPGALPPTAIDWSLVGPGWLLIDHGPWYGETAALDERGFYLVSPDDAVYGVSALPNDGSWHGDVSADGRRVLIQQFDDACADGCSCPGSTPGSTDLDVRDDSAVQQQVFGFSVLDLTTTSLRPVIDPVTVPVCATGVFDRQVEFTTDGNGIWVTETWHTDAHRATHVRLSRLAIDTGVWTTIVDEPVDVRGGETRSTAAIGFVELEDGRVVVGTRRGARVLDADGSPVRTLDVPHPDCEFQRVWDADHVLARCPAVAGEHPLPAGMPAAECPATGLWLVALDGAPTQVLAIPHHPDGVVACWVGYARAEQLGDELAVGAGGDGCSDGVVLIATDGAVTQWLPDDLVDSCTEMLLGVRNGAWLLSAHSEFGEGGTYEVTGVGATRLDLPSGRITVL